jgi:branched-chain amino acid transport system permease protein
MLFWQLLLQGLAAGAGYALIAVGFALIYSTTRTFHFAHGVTYSLAAYAYYASVQTLHWHPVAAIVVAACIAVAFGVGVDAVVYQPMRRTAASFLTLFAASFGVFVVVVNCLVLIFGNSFYSLSGELSRGIEYGPFVVSLANIAEIALGLVLIPLMLLIMHRTRLGTYFRAMADNGELVEVFGFTSRRYVRAAFAIGSLCVVPAAVLSPYIGGIQPGTATVVTLVAMAATIIGGIDSIAGAALGGLLLGVAENVGIWQLSSAWKPAISFGILLLFLIIRPRGILGAKARRA